LNAVGVWFYSVTTNRYLYLLRNDDRNPGTWGLPGGKAKSNETLLETITRECIEELGFWPTEIKLVPIEKFTSPRRKLCVSHIFL
jgi:8-oxo-dGTP pyrophosphatase MutT (NUDIX family)